MPVEVQSLADQTTQASTTQADPASIAATASAAQSGASSQAATKPEYLADDYWNAETGAIDHEKFGTHFKELSEFKKSADERAAQVPADPKDYKFELPADLTLPEGVKREDIKLSEAAVAAFAPVAKELGLTNADANKLLGMYVTNHLNEQAASATRINERVAQERTTLGGDAKVRVDAIETFLTAHLGEDAAKPMMSGIFTAAQVKGFESLMKAFEGGKIVPFTRKNPDGGEEPGKIPGFETMSFEQRRAAQDAARSKG